MAKNNKEGTPLGFRPTLETVQQNKIEAGEAAAEDRRDFREDMPFPSNGELKSVVVQQDTTSDKKESYKDRSISRAMTEDLKNDPNYNKKPNRMDPRRIPVVGSKQFRFRPTSIIRASQ
jgi:hypothetical protein